MVKFISLALADLALPSSVFIISLHPEGPDDLMVSAMPLTSTSPYLSQLGIAHCWPCLPSLAWSAGMAGHLPCTNALGFLATLTLCFQVLLPLEPCDCEKSRMKSISKSPLCSATWNFKPLNSFWMVQQLWVDGLLNQVTVMPGIWAGGWEWEGKYFGLLCWFWEWFCFN